jgi:Type II/IV secretion system protein
MADFERIITAYERGLRQLSDAVFAKLDPSAEERDRIQLLDQLLVGLLQSYGSYHLSRASQLDASTSVMYASATQQVGGRAAAQLLNVPLRSLVDSNTVSTWQARFLNSSLGMKRSLIVTGTKQTGKSTLLNSLVQLLPVDQRLVAIEDDEQLPALRGRSFTVHLTAKPGTPASANALGKAAGMHPTWIVLGELQRGDALPFLRALGGGISGLATIVAPDPEVVLIEWLGRQPELAEHLRLVAPLVAHVDRNNVGQPRLARLCEVTVGPEGLRFKDRRAT